MRNPVKRYAERIKEDKRKELRRYPILRVVNGTKEFVPWH